MSTPSPSPCRRLCVLNPVTRLCDGCARTLAEIAGWSAFSEKKRTDLLRELPGRGRVQAIEPL